MYICSRKENKDSCQAMANAWLFQFIIDDRPKTVRGFKLKAVVSVCEKLKS